VSRLAIVGDALLDRDLDGRAERLAPDAPVPVVDAIAPHDRPGGAGLAAAGQGGRHGTRDAARARRTRLARKPRHQAASAVAASSPSTTLRS
jgi:hypothetical protein